MKEAICSLKNRPNQKTRLTVTAIFMVTSLILSAFVVGYTGRCDPYSYVPPLTGIEVEGAHIVSEGAYFRFWLYNNNSYPVQAKMRGQKESQIVPPFEAVDFNVIAPKIGGVYQTVTYEFYLTCQGNATLVSLPVIVVNSFFVQIFNPLATILLIVIAVMVAAVVLVTLQRRRSPGKTSNEIIPH